MSSELTANILGINGGVFALGGTAGKSTNGVSKTGTGEFDQILTATFSGQSPAQIVQGVGASMASILAAISSSYNMAERENLALTYRDSVLQALQANGVNAEAGNEADKITIDGTTYDILRSLNSPGSTVATQLIEYHAPAAPAAGQSRTAADVVYSTAAANGELIQKIDQATTVEERLSLYEELRDLIVDALNESGNSAYSYGKVDKIVINGELFDIFKAVDGVGEPTKIQMLSFGPASAHGITPPAGTASTTAKNTGSSYSGDLSSAIFAAGASSADILKQISDSEDLEERTALARQFQDLVIQGLTGMGYTAEALGEADKISVNGTQFDIIRSLNSPGEAAYFQTLRIA